MYAAGPADAARPAARRSADVGLRPAAAPAAYIGGGQAPAVPRERGTTLVAGPGGPAFDRSGNTGIARWNRRWPAGRTHPAARQLQAGVPTQLGQQNVLHPGSG